MSSFTNWFSRNWLLLLITFFPMGMYFLSKSDDKSADHLQVAAITCGVLAFLFLIVIQYRREQNGGEPSGPKKDVADRNRTFLTIWLVTMGIVLIAVFGFFVNSEETSDAAENAKWVFSAAVPLIASWIGTVLAFYFGRENFEVATEYMLGLNKDTLDNISVNNMMISEQTMVYINVNDDNQWVKYKDNAWVPEDDQSLAAIIELFRDVRKDRVPILTEGKEPKPKYITHLAFLMEAEKEKTLAEFFTTHDGLFGFTQEKGFVTVSAKTSLEEANKTRSQQENTRDIFVTADGTNNSHVLGWVPDTLAERFLNIRE